MMSLHIVWQKHDVLYFTVLIGSCQMLRCTIKNWSRDMILKTLEFIDLPWKNHEIITKLASSKKILKYFGFFVKFDVGDSKEIKLSKMPWFLRES